MTELISASHLNNWERVFRSLWGDGRSCVHALRESARGPKPAQNRRTGYWYAMPSRANLRKRLWCGAIWMWKYASFKSTDATSPRGECEPGSVPAISFWTDACRALCWWSWDLESSGVLHPSWPPQNSGCKSYFPARSPGFVLLLLFRAGCIALVSGPGHFEAMLETAPRRWNRVVCIWIEGRTHALSHRVTSVRFSE